MSDNTLTIALEGDVKLSEFNTAMRHFQSLVDLLSRELAEGTEIDWMIEDLYYGSAIATVAGIALEDEPVLKVVDAYSKVGQSLERREPIPFSSAVAREAGKIAAVVSDKIIAVRFQTADTEATIYGAYDAERLSTPSKLISFGSVKGRVQAISNRGKLRFTLYDSIFDKQVSCYLQDGQETQMREIWGKQVFVTGQVTREPEFGRATAVRNITSIDPVIEIKSGSYRDTRGILPWTVGDEPAEVSIRRVRDGEND